MRQHQVQVRLRLAQRVQPLQPTLLQPRRQRGAVVQELAQRRGIPRIGIRAAGLVQLLRIEALPSLEFGAHARIERGEARRVRIAFQRLEVQFGEIQPVPVETPGQPLQARTDVYKRQSFYYRTLPERARFMPEDSSTRDQPADALRSRRQFLLAAAALAAAGPLARAQQQEPTFSTDVNVVNLLAGVRTKRGDIVRDLTKDDFVLLENGRPQTIRYFSRESDLPLTLGLMVDTSGRQRHVLDLSLIHI